jgi:tetratricopeptide (TPR) repeat protein
MHGIAKECTKRDGQTDSAYKHIDKAIEINPNYALAWYNKGIALIKLENILMQFHVMLSQRT